MKPLKLFFLIGFGAAAVSGPFARAQNLVVNGDFSNGTNGFTSAYTFVASPATGTLPSRFGIRTSSTNFNPNDVSFGDHTTGAGSMLLAAGSSVANAAVWSETIAITPDASYFLAFWGASANATSHSTLQFQINGNATGPVFSMPSSAGQWQLFQTSFASGGNTNAVVSLVDTDTARTANDFALDDVAMVPATALSVAPPAQTVECGSSPTFTVTPTGVAPFGYQWYRSNPAAPVPLAGQIGPTLNFASITPRDAGTFYVVVTNAFGGVQSQSVTLNVVDTTPPVITPGGAQAVYPDAPMVQGSDGNFYGTTQQGGPNNDGTIYSVTSLGVLSTIYTFTNGTDGSGPYGALVQGGDGLFYGATKNGGPNNYGTIFRVTTAGLLTTLHNFNGFSDGFCPASGLILARDGNFYGTAQNGGTNDYGTIYRMTPAGAFTALYSFTGGNDGSQINAGLVQGNDGNFYGMATYAGANGAGNIFQFTPGGNFTTLYLFTNGVDGEYPESALTLGADGNFYGTTSSGTTNGYGSAFQTTSAGVVTVLYDFTNGSDGGGPYGGLVQAGDGNFYGTTVYGGADYGGVVFQLTPSGLLNTLYPFTGGADGSRPQAPLALGHDGNLYGTTIYGGANGDGTLFQITTTGIFTTLNSFLGSTLLTVECHDFFSDPGATAFDACDGPVAVSTINNVDPNTPGVYAITYIAADSSGNTATNTRIVDVVDNTPPSVTLNGGDGTDPMGPLVQGANGNFYGVTYLGGADNSGTVFEVTSVGLITTLYSFTGGTDGSYPFAGLVLANDGNFYGGTTAGGAGGGGTVFRMTPSGALATIHAFNPSMDGATLSGLLQGDDGNLYGTTEYGGTNFYGAFFGMTLAGNLTSVYSFGGTNDGATPTGLTRGSDGNFYGVTQSAGAGYGTVFKVSASAQLIPLYSFSGGGDGAQPVTGLVQGGNGDFYGATSEGGAGGSGTIFEMNPIGALTTLYSLNPVAAEGASRTVLVLGRDGNIYGSTFADGTNGNGTLFQLTPAGQLTTLHTFTGILDGANPAGGMVQAGDGNFYGATEAGGAGGAGTFFKLSPSGALIPLAQFGGALTVPCGVPFRDPGAVAADTCAGNLPVLTTSPVDASTSGTYLIIYTATDPSGNQGFASRAVTVIDSAPPSLQIEGGSTLQVVQGSSFADPGAVAVGSCGNPVPVISYSTVNLSVPGSYTVSYVATSQSGLSVTNTRAITVTAPADCVAPPDGLVAWWPGQTNTVDIVGGNNGRLENGASYAAGFDGSAFDFTGGSQAVLIPYSPSTDLTALSAFTIEAWINPAGYNNDLYPTIYSYGYWSASLGLNSDTGVLESWFNNNSQATGDIPVPLGQWSHVALVYDGTNRTFYLNGLAAGSSPAPPLEAVSSDSAIGSVAQIDPNSTFSGLIDEVSIYNRALSSNEIAGIYDAGSFGKCVVYPPPSIAEIFPDAGTAGNLVLINGAGLLLATNVTFHGQPANFTVQSGSQLIAYVPASATTGPIAISTPAGTTVASRDFTVTPAPSCLTAPSGLLGWWPGDGNADDVLGLDNGALQNGAAFAPGFKEQAFLFDGVTSFVDLGSIAPAGAWTIEAWVNPSALPAGRHTIAGGVSACADWAITMDDGQFGVRTPPPGGACTQDTPAAVPITPGTWYHVAGTCDGINAFIYVNGVLQNFAPVSLNYTPFSGDIEIGSESCCPQDSFPGLVDEVAMYNRALAPSEIAALYDAGPAGKCAPAGGHFAVVVQGSPAAGGSVTGAGSFLGGTGVSVRATPSAQGHWAFLNWSEDGVPVSANPVYTFAIFSDHDLIANFVGATNQIIRQPADHTVETGSQASFSATVSSALPLLYQWYFSRAPLAGATNATLELTNLSSSQAGSYVLVAGNSFGSVTTRVVTLTVVGTMVSVTSPANGAAFPAPGSFSINAAASDPNGIQEVDFYLDGLSQGALTAPPYTLPVTGLGAGSHALSAVAIDSLGLSRTSAVVHVTVNNPGMTLIDFEGLDTSAGAAGGVALSNYLAGFGVMSKNVTPATTSLVVANDGAFLGGGVVQASSGDNFLTQIGPGGSVFFTLSFSQPYATVSWTRPRLLAGTMGASAPAWRAVAFDAAGNQLGAVSAGAIAGLHDVAARQFTLLGSNGMATISSIRFHANNNGAAALTSLPLDDLLLSTVPVASTLAVTLTNLGGPVATAPAQLVLSASVLDSLATVTNVDFYEGDSLVGSVAPVGGVARVTLYNLAAGTESFTAMASDTLGTAAGAAPLTVTVQAAAGVNVINFDALDTSAGSVGGAALSNYLAAFGLTLTNVTVGTALEAVNAGSLTATAGAAASSPPNFFTQAGLNQPVSFTLRLATPVQGFGFTRVALIAGAGGVSHPRWTATALDRHGVELGAVTEDLIVSATNFPARIFQLTGNGIAAVRFDSDSRGTAAFSAVLLDDLVLTTTPAPPVFAAAISSPPNNDTSFVAPANITLSATVVDEFGPNFYVSFYAGATFLGSLSNSPYSFLWTNVAAGNYALRARVVDAAGLTALSGPVRVGVGAGGNATVVNFDALNAGNAPVTGAVLSNYLAAAGMKVTAISPGTALAVENQGVVGRGSAVQASSPPNIMTQTGSNGPVSFTVSFTPWLSQFGFTRPELLANPFINHPAWQVTAFDAAGIEIGQAGEDQISSYTNVNAAMFNLGATGGPGIATVQFSSQGTGLTTFNAMLADDFVLTTNAGLFPPAVAITEPVAGLQLIAPAAVTVGADAVDDSGIAQVSFYAGGTLIGTTTTAPFTVQWTNPPAGEYTLTAVALDNAALSRTSPAVNVSIAPAEDQFGILAQPAGRTVATGGSVTFSIITTGTNAVSYQWLYNGSPIGNQTASTLTLYPVQEADAGTYRVMATSAGVILTSHAALLHVLDPPVITNTPMSQTVSAGTDVSLSVGVDGDGPLDWQWTLNGARLPGATNSSLVLPGAQPLNSGAYRVIVRNPVAFSRSAPAQIVVQAENETTGTADNFADRIGINPLLGPVQGNNQNATAEPGEPMPDGKPGGKSIWYTWTASFTGVISLTTQGSDFDTLLAVYTGTNVAQLTPVAADDDSGGFFTSLVTFNVTQGVAYQIAVDGFKGASGDVILGMPAGTGYRVLSPASGSSVPVIIQGPTNQLVQAGARVTLGVKASSATPLTYQWYFQGAPVSGATAASLVLNNFQMGAVGQYDVLVANAVGSVSSEPASLQIAVVNQPGGSASSQDKFGDAVDLATQGRSVAGIEPAAGGGDTRGFSIAQTFSTVGATKEPGEPDHCGQAGGASQWYVYTAPGAGTLHVSTAGSAFNTILAVYTGPGTDFAGLVEQGCGYTTNFQMNGQPDVLIPNVAAQTKFFLVVDGYHGASGVVQLHVGLGVAPALVNVPADRLVTPGGNATFTVSALGSTNFSYQWQLNGVNLAHANNSSYTVTNAQAAAAGSYTVVVSNVVAAVTSAPPALLTLQYAPAITNGPAGQTVLLGKKAGFAVAASGVNVKTNSFHYQWYDNGAALGRATNATLTFVPAQWTNQGSYQVIITNTYGSATSAVVTLTVQDLIPPTVTIHSPANNFQSRTNLLTVSGTAADQAGVDRVQVQVNNNPFQTAAGSNAWSLAVTLAPGPNVITAQSVDVAGNHSAAVHRAVNYLVSGPLIVQTNGQGKTTSATGAVNGALLQIGRSYTIAASALPGGAWLFADWSSGVGGPLTYLSSDATLTFQMASNLVLQANFVTNPFPALAGAYNGLFYPAAGITEAGSGFFNLALPPRGAGAFSAQIKLDGGTYGFTGTFTPLGDAHALIPRRGKTPLTLTLRLNLQPPDDHITGLVSNALWQSPLQGDRAVFDPLTNPAVNYAGQFTMVIPPAPTAPDGSPAGYGYAAITNTPGGQATVVGVLADGSAFSQSVPIARDGSIPFYASLYGTKTTPGQGSIMGWLTFTNVPPQTLFGPLNWIKPAIPRTLYPLGFTNQTQILGSPYLMPPLGAPPLNLATPTLTLTNGGLVPPLIYNLTFVGADLTNQDLLPTNHVALAINPTNGIITITFQSPGARTNTIGHAIILQTSAQALGSFPTPTQPGAIIIK